MSYVAYTLMAGVGLNSGMEVTESVQQTFVGEEWRQAQGTSAQEVTRKPPQIH